MIEPSPTLASLVELGFKREAGNPAETVRYEFENFHLGASSVWWWTGRMVMLSGWGSTRRTLSVMDPGSKMIPNDLGDIWEAAAWVSFMLQHWRKDLGALPDWFVEGERHWDLVPPARAQLAYRERQRAYEASPKCMIDRDYARPLRRNLTEEISRLGEGEGVEMIFSFDGRVLTIDSSRYEHEVLATGDPWPTSYRTVVTPDSKLPPRFEREWVEVCAFEGHLCWNGLPFGAEMRAEEEYIPEEPTHPLSDPDLYIEYAPATDILYLSGIGPVIGSFGDTVAENLVVFTNEAGDENVGVVIHHAAAILLPHLLPGKDPEG